MDTIDQLPHLCLKRIFSFLNLRDLISCRAVNRQFKLYADEETVDELVVGDDMPRCNELCTTWYQTSRPIDHGSSLGPNAFESLKPSLFKLNEQLKFLHVHIGYRFDLNSVFKNLGNFRQLEHLEIGADYYNKKEPVTVILPNLKVLQVIGHELLDARFILNTPKLEVLTCGEISRIKVEHPETIKRLECLYDGYSSEVDKFKNVQVLILESRVREFGNIHDCLSDWVHLKELHLNVAFYSDDVLSDSFMLDCKSVLLFVMREKAELKREDLKLYTQGVLLIDEEQLNDYGLITSIPFKMKNYQRLYRDSYPEAIEMDYNCISDLELTGEFFDRFPGIHVLTSTGPVERDRFEWFLQNATELSDLQLTNTSLDQAFMERLPKLISRLGNLELKGSCDQITNFDFILQFEQLWCFVTDKELGSLDLATKAFQQLKKLHCFEFRSGNKSVDIHRRSTDKENYSLRIKDFRKENLKWNELVAHYEQEIAGEKNKPKIKRTRRQ